MESFFFTPTPQFDFQAGQFLYYTIPHLKPDERGVSRYFTIASAPFEPDIILTTRFTADHPSTFKQALKNLPIGHKVAAEGPGGLFIYQDPTQPAVFMAGGIGITPFRAILMDLNQKDLDAPIVLLYANRTPDIPYKKLFDELAPKHPHLKIVYTIDQPTPNWTGEIGKIDENFIKKHVPDWSERTYYVSGPKPMVLAIGYMLEGMGLSKNQVKHDFFPGYENY